MLQNRAKEVSDLNEINKKSLQQISEMNKTVESLNIIISEQKTELAEYSTQESNLKTILQAKEKEIDDLKEQLNKVDLPNSCSDMNNYSGLLSIQPKGLDQFIVSCDSLLAGSGWTVIQRRINGSENFFRNWEEYKQGFGNVEGEFFIGLEKLHLMTKERSYELYIHLVDQANEVRYARYDNFRVANEAEKYKLVSVGDYKGTAGDSMTYNKGQYFSTIDQDNDAWRWGCAGYLKGCWWYKDCTESNLNDENFDCALENSIALETTGCIYWNDWHGHSYSLKNVQMMIRPWGHE